MVKLHPHALVLPCAAAALAALAALAAVGSVAAASGARTGVAATPTTVVATLNAGQERPHPKGAMIGANGRFTATLSGTTLTWRLTFAHLTGPATAAHIHTGARGKPGPVAVPLCGPCSSPASGTATLTAPQLAALRSGGLYVNVHTAANPGGEIRGQLAEKVPKKAAGY